MRFELLDEAISRTTPHPYSVNTSHPINDADDIVTKKVMSLDIRSASSVDKDRRFTLRRNMLAHIAVLTMCLMVVANAFSPHGPRSSRVGLSMTLWCVMQTSRSCRQATCFLRLGVVAMPIWRESWCKYYQPGHRRHDAAHSQAHPEWPCGRREQAGCRADLQWLR